MKTLTRLLPILMLLFVLCCFAALATPINPALLGGVGMTEGGSGGKNYKRGGVSGGAGYAPGGGTCAEIGVDFPDNPFRGWPVERHLGSWQTISAWYCDPDYFKGYTHWGIDLSSRIYRGESGKIIYDSLDHAAVTSTALKAVVKGAANDGGYHSGMGNFVILYHVTCSTYCGTIPKNAPEDHHYQVLESSSDSCSTVIFTPAPRSTAAVEYEDLIEECVESGWKASYFHLYDINVGIGDIVEYGDVLGWIDNSGCSTGPHLHYQINRPKDQGGHSIDPAPAMCEAYSNALLDTYRWERPVCPDYGS